MPVKRKRSSTTSSQSNKKARKKDEIDLDDSDVYEVLGILDESKDRYLIAWAPNKSSGEVYEPTWEPKANVTEAAIEDWKAKKQRSQAPASAPQATLEPQIEKRERGRPKKGIAFVRKTSPVGKTESQSSPSPKARAPRTTRRPPDSSPLAISASPEQHLLSKSQADAAAEEVDDSAQSHSIQLTSQSISLPSSEQRAQIQLLRLRDSQRAGFPEPSSPSFQSSQVLVGTAPDLVPDPSSQPSTSQEIFIDAAAAPNLTQKHSQYQLEDTIESTDHVTSAVDTTESSKKSPHTKSILSDRAVVSDSQSFFASQSFVPATQSASKTSESQSLVDNLTEQESDLISDSSISCRKSLKQRGKRQASQIQQLDVIANDSSSRTANVSVSETVNRKSTSVKGRAGRKSLSRTRTESPTLPSSAFAETHLTAIDTSQSRSKSDPPSTITIASGNIPEEAILETVNQDYESRIQGSDASSCLAFQSRADFPPERSSNSEKSHPLDHFKTPVSQLASPNETLATKSCDRQHDQFKTQISQSISSGASVRAARPVKSLVRLLQNVKDDQSPRQHTISPNRKLHDHRTRSQALEVLYTSIPQPPDNWPETLRSAPDRPCTLFPLSQTPRTPSDQQKMASTSPRSVSEEATAKVQALKAAGGPTLPAQRSLGMTTRSVHRARSPITARDARSPSTVPHEESFPMPSYQDFRTSERYLTLVPDEAQGMDKVARGISHGIIEEVENSSPLKPVQNAEDLSPIDASPLEEDSGSQNVFHLPVYFLGRQRDYYKQLIIHERKFLESFLVQAQPSEADLAMARRLMTMLRNVTSHPDLLNPENFSQETIEPKLKAQYDMDTSAKFRFVGSLLEELKGEECHVVIELEGAQLLEIFETFLTGIEVEHVVAGTKSHPSVNDVRVTLLPRQASSEMISSTADVVIGFEGHPQIMENHRLRLRTWPSGTVAPLIYLVTPRSMEHVESLLASKTCANMPKLRRFMMLIENSALLRMEAGFRQAHEQSEADAVSRIAEFVADRENSRPWPGDRLSHVVVKESISGSQASTESESPNSVRQTASVKRRLERDLEDSSTSPKRVRTRRPKSSSQLTPDMNRDQASSSLITALSDSSERRVVATSEYVSNMEEMRITFEARETTLKSQLAALQARLDEHVSALEDLQYRHEDQRMALVGALADRDQAVQKTAVAIKQLNARDTVLAKVRAERDTLKEELAKAQASLLSHEVPETAALEEVRSQLATANKDRTRLEGRVKAASQEADYVRGLYQEASGRAAELAGEKERLESSRAELERRAAGAVMLPQQQQSLVLSRDGARKALRDEVRALRCMVADREGLLVAKEEEIGRLRRKGEREGRGSVRVGGGCWGLVRVVCRAVPVVGWIAWPVP